MAFSGSISGTQFNALKVVDHAFRRCRLPAQSITSEMQQYALESLYMMLSSLSNDKTPSWCIERQVYPFYEGQPVITLDVGTVEVLNANYRTLQHVTGDVTIVSPTVYKVDFVYDQQTEATVNVVGVKWSGASSSLTFAVSDDDTNWTTVGTQTDTVVAGEWTWTDISAAFAHRYFRITAAATFNYDEVFLGCLPQEIPMGVLNKDTYVAQSNKVFKGRPLTYWFQRNITQPTMNLWPAPNADAEHAQLIVWRHRHIMDTQNLQQDVEIPQRWLEAINDGLALRMARETPSVDANLIPSLEQYAANSLQKAWDGDNDGSPTYINPGIGGYTK